MVERERRDAKGSIAVQLLHEVYGAAVWAQTMKDPQNTEEETTEFESNNKAVCQGPHQEAVTNWQTLQLGAVC